FLNNKFEDSYTPTIEDFHRKLYRIRNELNNNQTLTNKSIDIKVGDWHPRVSRRLPNDPHLHRIRDFGTEKHQALLSLGIKANIHQDFSGRQLRKHLRIEEFQNWSSHKIRGDLFVLVFSMDSRESFEEVVRLREQILETKHSACASANSSGGRKKTALPRVPMIFLLSKTTL
ncbi:hypothetical protein C0J52_00866, partial [Blattella germanica]